MAHSIFKGVTFCEGYTKPWRAQATVAGKNYSLGQFATEEEAARAYDNFVFYLVAAKLNTRDFELNFPDEYSCDSFPSQFERTLEVIFDIRQRSTFARTHEPSRAELITHLKELVTVGDRARTFLLRYGIEL